MKADKDTGQTLMSGMGTLHLEVKQHRLERDFRLKVRVGKPRVSYREMLRSPRTVEVEVDRLGDKPAFAELKVSFTNFEARAAGGGGERRCPAEAAAGAAGAAAAERGSTDALQTGELGYPMMNVQATDPGREVRPAAVERGRLRRARRSRRTARRRADNVQLLEPIMKVTVTTPAEFLGNVIGDLTARRGQIERQESVGGDLVEVEALVPLAELFDYADRVRSLSQGRAASAMEPHTYEPAPDEVLRQLLGE